MTPNTALKLHGVLTALITPFKNGDLDLPALRQAVRRQLDAGVHGLVPLGSTGEAATLSFEERARVIETVVGETARQVPIIVGTGTNNTATSIEATRQAQTLGADAAMLVTPYYNKPTPAGLLAHYQAVAQAVEMPLLAYNVPGRTGLNLEPAAAEKIAKLPALVGLKEASGNVAQVADIVRRTEKDWVVLSGEDALFLPILAVGGQGIICTTSNAAPKPFVRLYNAFEQGNLAAARREQLDLLPLIAAMFTVANPMPVKAACALLGHCAPDIRLPLTPLDETRLADLRQTLKDYRLL